jgi:hypothetical protein
MAASFSIERVVLGFALLGLGVLWMLANAGRLDLLSTLRTWWPSLLVLWGGLELAHALVLRPRGANPRSDPPGGS